MTLTEVSYYFRKTAPMAIFIFIFLIFFYFLINLMWPIIFPPPTRPLITDPVFGKIPPVNFSYKINYPSNVDFILDTIEGEPITATATAKIYYLPSKSPRFGYLQAIYLMAKNLGFDTEKIKHKIEDKNAIFQDEEKELIVDISNFNFEYKYRYENNEQLFQNSIIPNENLIKEQVKEFLRMIGRYPEELAKGRENIIFLAYDSSTKEFNVVKRKEEANAVEIDFYRPDIDGFSTVSPKYFNSQNFVVGVFEEDKFKFIKAQIKFFEKEEEKFGIYPLKTGEEAWRELKEGKANIVFLGERVNQIMIKKMFLAYYDPDFYQEYLQPVYVFLGDQGFVAYVSAVKSERD